MIGFDLANSVNPDKMPHYVAFHLGLQCLLKYSLRVHQFTKGLITSKFKDTLSQGHLLYRKDNMIKCDKNTEHSIMINGQS